MWVALVCLRCPFAWLLGPFGIMFGSKGNIHA